MVSGETKELERIITESPCRHCGLVEIHDIDYCRKEQERNKINSEVYK